MKLNKSLALATVAGAFLAGAGLAVGAMSPGSEALMQSMTSMDKAMKMEMTGDVDIDFYMMMIPHHQGAIDMAKVELQYGKDPEARAMAEKVIAAQEAEIAEMKAWLSKKGHSAH